MREEVKMEKLVSLIKRQSALERQHSGYEFEMHLLKRFCGTNDNNVVVPGVIDKKSSPFTIVGHGLPGEEYGSGQTRRVDHAEYAFHALSLHNHALLVSEDSFLTMEASGLDPYFKKLQRGDLSGKDYSDSIDEGFRTLPIPYGDGISLAQGYAYFLGKKTLIEGIITSVEQASEGNYYGDVAVVFSRMLAPGNQLVSRQLYPPAIPSTDQALRRKGYALSSLKEVVVDEMKALESIGRTYATADKKADNSRKFLLTVKNV